MIFLEKESTIFVNHRELVMQAYNKCDTSNSTCAVSYFLKSGLFSYRETSHSSKRKKKGLLFKESLNRDEEETEIAQLQISVNSIIHVIKEHIRSNRDDDSFQFSNHVFHSQNFPIFRGENNTESVIIYETNAKRKYVIPPRCRFFNHDIRDIKSIEPFLGKFDLIVIDPPWKNKYIRRIKRIKLEYGYKMLENNEFAEIPIKHYIKQNSIIAIWCTNSETHRKNIVEKLLPSWNLKLLKKLYWIKLNRRGDVICKFHNPGQKQPYEILFVAVPYEFHELSDHDPLLNNVNYIVSSSSVIHSHKPPLLEIFKKHLPENPKCLDLFARYLYPEFTSVGLEVLKLMDIRLYDVFMKAN